MGDDGGSFLAFVCGITLGLLAGYFVMRYVWMGLAVEHGCASWHITSDYGGVEFLWKDGKN